jgi:hypothetical protein
MQAACCVTTRGDEAPKPSDDAWEAARAVCGVPGARDIQNQDWFCLLRLPRTRPGPTVRL